MEKDEHLSKRTDILIVISFLIIAAVFIFDHISLMVFWSDEAAAANVISNSFFDLLAKANADFQPMFFIYLLKSWAVFFGDGVFALRALSAFWALALIVLFYKVSKEFFGKKTAIIVSALASSNFFLIWFATQARPYTLAAFLCLSSYYLFCKTFDDPKKKYLAGYVIVTFLGLYTHPWFYFIFATQVLCVFCFNFSGRTSKKILILQAVVLFLSAPSILISLYQSSIGANSWMSVVTLADVFNSLKFLSFGSTWLYIIFTTACVIWIKSDDERIYYDLKQRILLLHFFVPLSLAFIVSQFSPIYSAGRYEMIVLPPFLMLIAILWSKIDYKILAVVFLLLLSFTRREVINQREMLESYKSSDQIMVAQIIVKAENNDLIITTDLSGPTFYYYMKHQNSDKKIEMISFPKELENHPGFKNMDLMLENKETYSKEADELSERTLKNKDIRNVWVVNLSSNEINSLLIESLKKNFKTFEVIYPDTPRQNSWFDEIYLFKKDNL